jgi:hypothetical protein
MQNNPLPAGAHGEQIQMLQDRFPAPAGPPFKNAMQRTVEPTSIISFDEVIDRALQGAPFSPRPGASDARPEPSWEEFLTNTVYPLMVRAAHDLNSRARQEALDAGPVEALRTPSVWRIVRSDAVTGSPSAPLYEVILVNDRGPELLDFRDGTIRRNSRGKESFFTPTISWWGAVETLDRYVHDAARAAFHIRAPEAVPRVA